MYKSARFLRLAVGLGVVLHAVTLSAASLWFGDKDGLHRIDTVTNQVVSSVAFEPAVAIVANAADGSLWALSQERLAHLGEQGAIQFKVAIRDLGTGLGAPRLLVLNPNDGSVWAGFENRVLHLDAAGVLRHALPIRARDLAVAQDGSVWVLGDSALHQHDAAGALVRSVAVPGVQKMKHLALDDTGGVVWVAGEKDLVQLRLSAPDQMLLSILAPETVSGISVDLQTGELWAIGQNGLFSYGRNGTPRVSRDLRDFSIAHPQTLLFDFSSQAAWVGHQRGLTRVTVAGTLAATFPAAVHVVTIAIGRTPLAIVPVVSIAAPADGALVNTGRPQLRVAYDALCGAVPCGFPNSFFGSFTLSALLNGTESGSLFVFDPATGGASLTPATRLPEGLNTFSAQARDSFGRFSDTVSSTFTIDTIAPSFANVTPATGSVFRNASIAIAGSVDDPAASVTLGGETQGASFRFAVTLGSPGPNAFALLARDAAGNTASLPLTYVYDPPPVPSVTIASPVANAAIEGNTVVVRGRIVAPAHSGVAVDDHTAAVDTAGNFAVLVPVAAGPNALTVTVTTLDRTSVTRSVSVSASGEPSPFAIDVSPATGFAPLTPVFTVSNPNGVDATFTFDGYGPFALPARSRSQVTVTYPAGVFVPEIVITANGWAFRQQVVIEARDEAEMDRMFRALWTGMNDALAAGDKETAMRYLNDSAQQKYGPVIEALMPRMPQIVASYSPLAQASISEHIGEYAVTRMDGETKRLYLIYFLRDATGVWRIDGM